MFHGQQAYMQMPAMGRIERSPENTHAQLGCAEPAPYEGKDCQGLTCPDP